MIKYFNELKENVLKIFVNPVYNKNNYCLIYFFTVFLFYILYKIITIPELLSYGDMLAESAVTYYLDSISRLIATQFFRPDSDYWVFLQRIIAIIGGILKLPAGVISYYYSWNGVFITSLLYAPFCLGNFRNIVSSDLFRFVICITHMIFCDVEILYNEKISYILWLGERARK